MKSTNNFVVMISNKISSLLARVLKHVEIRIHNSDTTLMNRLCPLTYLPSSLAKKENKKELHLKYLQP